MRERSLSQIHIEGMTELEDEMLKPRRRRRAAPSKPQVVETPEERAAREAKLAAERAFHNAILLIQSHERARKGRCLGEDGNYMREIQRETL